MSESNIIIFAGGSGNKVNEWLVNLGLISKKTRIVKIDYDEDQTKSERGKTSNQLRIESNINYQKMNEKELTQGAQIETQEIVMSNYITEIRQSQDSKLSRTDYTIGTLNSFTELNSDDQSSLLNLSFTEEMQKMKVNNGLFQKPDMGSLINTIVVEKSKNLLTDILGDGVWSSVTKLNVAIVGSSFGGTGASLLPMLSKKIREKIIEAGPKCTLTIGGFILNPYFAVKDGGENETEQRIKTENFYSHSADYMHFLEQGSGVFDKTFVYQTELQLQEFKDYKESNQSNPGTIHELFMADAISKFINKPDDFPSKGTYNIPDVETKRITWENINDLLKKKIVRQLRFAFLIQKSIYPNWEGNFNGSTPEYDQNAVRIFGDFKRKGRALFVNKEKHEKSWNEGYCQYSDAVKLLKINAETTFRLWGEIQETGGAWVKLCNKIESEKSFEENSEIDKILFDNLGSTCTDLSVNTFFQKLSEEKDKYKKKDGEYPNNAISRFVKTIFNILDGGAKK